MSTEVDWDWQISNRPTIPDGYVQVTNDPSPGPYRVSEILFQNSSGIFVDEFGEVSIHLGPTYFKVDNIPNTGPYSGTILFFDNYTGLQVDSYLTATLIPAQGVQPGGVSFGKTQQLLGYYWLAPTSASKPPSSLTSIQTPVLVLEDGGLTLYSSSDVDDTTSLCGWSYTGGNPGSSDIYCPGNFSIQGAQRADGVVQIASYTSGSTLNLPGVGTAASLSCSYGVDLVASSSFTLQMLPSVFSSPSIFEIGDTVNTAVYAADGYYGGTLTDPVGNQFYGGILIGGGLGSISGDVTGTLGASELVAIQGNPVIAPTPAIGDTLVWNGTDWVNTPGGGGGLAIGSPVSGATPGDWLVVDGSGNLAEVAMSLSASGDLSGTYPGPTVAAIAGYPVSISGPTTGQVLTWNGSAWDAESPSAGTSISQAGGSVAVTSAGGIYENSASGQDVELLAGTGGADLHLFNSGEITLYGAGGYGFELDSSGGIYLGGSHGTLTLPATGSAVLTGGVGGSVSVGTSGQITEQPASGQDFTWIVSPGQTYMEFLHTGAFGFFQNYQQLMFINTSGDLLFGGSGGNFILRAAGGALLSNAGGGVIQVDSTGDVLLSPLAGKGFGVFGGGPATQQANASQADITAVLDPNAQAALQAIYDLLHAYGWAPATA